MNIYRAVLVERKIGALFVRLRKMTITIFFSMSNQIKIFDISSDYWREINQFVIKVGLLSYQNI